VPFDKDISNVEYHGFNLTHIRLLKGFGMAN
jgi:hypothetical protein